MLNDFSAEVIQMRAWYDLACQKKKRTAIGITGFSFQETAEFLSAFVNGDLTKEKMINTPLSDSIRMAAEDLKAYYFEAVSVQPGQPTDSLSLANWF